VIIVLDCVSLLILFSPRHSKICRKVFKQKRKVFDSAKARTKGTELAQYLNSNKKGGGSSSSRANQTRSSVGASSVSRSSTMGAGRGGGDNGKGGMAKWKAESLSFREAIRQARMVSHAEKKSKQTGIPLHVLLPASAMQSSGPDYAEMNYLQCPTCGRSFSQKAGERHIPQVRRMLVYFFFCSLCFFFVFYFRSPHVDLVQEYYQ
jgi:hypothetical protein